jgi:hypothetical protein
MPPDTPDTDDDALSPALHAAFRQLAAASTAPADFLSRVMGQVRRTPLWPQEAVAVADHAHDQASQALSVPAPLIGRMAERQLLARRLHVLLTERMGSTLVIEGEAGIGKSSLVADLAQQARAAGVVILTGAGAALEQATPYYAWRAVFQQLFHGADGGDESATQRARVLAQLPMDPVSERLLPLLNAVLPLGLPETPHTTQLTGQVRADNTHALLRHLLRRAVAQTPTLLILEDAHWLDSASWALTHLLSQEGLPVLLVLVTRSLPSSLPLAYRQILAAPMTQRLLLEALPSDDTVALVCQRLGVASLPAPVATLIQERAAGHPFFSEELAYALRDMGLIRIANGTCACAPQAGDLRTLALPESVDEVITSRFNRLTPAQQLTLQVASVLGVVFALRTLQDIYPPAGDPARLGDALAGLQRAGFAHLHTSAPARTYHFKHVITQGVTYSSLSPAQRQQLHHAAAEWYERTYSAERALVAPLLAYHWRQANVIDKALDALQDAGAQALRGGAFAEAVRFFQEALALTGPARAEREQWRQAHWERQLGEALYGLGQTVESQAHFARALALLHLPVPTSQAALVVNLLGQVVRQGWHRVRPGRIWPARREGPEVVIEAVRAYERLCNIYYLSGAAMWTVWAGIRALNLAEAAGEHSSELARAYATCCLGAGCAGWHALATRYRHRARALSSASEDRATHAGVLVTTSFYDISVGHWAAVHDALPQARTIWADLGDQRRWEESTGCLGLALFYQGAVARGAALFAEVAASAQRRRDPQLQVHGLAAQADMVLRLGQIDAARALGEQGLALCAAQATHFAGDVTIPSLHVTMARVALRQGQWLHAYQEVEQAAALLTQAGLAAPWALEAYAGLAEVYLTLWEMRSPPGSSQGQALARAARRACHTLAAYARQMPIARPRALLQRGRYAWLRGKRRQAYRAWRAGLAAAVRFEMPYEQGLAHYEIGRHAALPDAVRQDNLRRACALFLQVEATDDLTRAQAALAAR